jgi:hypothetical protein
MFMPRSRPRRASSPKAINLAICVVLNFDVPNGHCSDRPAMTAAHGAPPRGPHPNRLALTQGEC